MNKVSFRQQAPAANMYVGISCQLLKSNSLLSRHVSGYWKMFLSYKDVILLRFGS